MIPDKMHGNSNTIIIDDIKYSISDLTLLPHCKNICSIPGNEQYIIKFYEKNKFEGYKKTFTLLCDKNFEYKSAIVPFAFPQEGGLSNAIIMEKYDGDLYKLLIDLKIKPTSSELIDIIEQTIVHIKHLFKKKLYYTDIKLENILYRKNNITNKYIITLGDIDSVFDANDNDIASGKYKINISYGQFFHLLDINASHYELREIEQIVIYSLGVTILKIFIYGFYKDDPELAEAFKYNIENIDKKNVENRQLLDKYNKVITLYEKSMCKYKIDNNKVSTTKRINDIITYRLFFERDNQLLQNCFKIFEICVLSAINRMDVNNALFNTLLRINKRDSSKPVFEI
jgi:hypothetical protein